MLGLIQVALRKLKSRYHYVCWRILRDKCKRDLKSTRNFYIPIYTRLEFHKILQRLSVLDTYMIRKWKVAHQAKDMLASNPKITCTHHKAFQWQTLQQELMKLTTQAHWISKTSRLPIKCSRNLKLISTSIRAFQALREFKIIHECRPLPVNNEVRVSGLRKKSARYKRNNKITSRIIDTVSLRRKVEDSKCFHKSRTMLLTCNSKIIWSTMDRISISLTTAEQGLTRCKANSRIQMRLETSGTWKNLLSKNHQKNRGNERSMQDKF